MRDDARHPSLRRARSLGQCQLGQSAPGRAQYGLSVVQEVHVRTALQDFGAGLRAPGPVWSLNPYLGCAHQCSYCYVPDTNHVERHRWGRYVVVKRNVATVLAHELHRRAKGRVYLCTGTDPYQPVEAEHRITRACLDRLVRQDWPLDVLTRSPLVLRDTDVLGEGQDVRVGLSVPTMDDEARRVVEPAAPPIDARLDALRRLSDAGLTTYANLAPAYPPSAGYTPEDIAATFADVGVQWVNFSAWRRLGSVLPVVAARVHDTPYQDLPAWVTAEAQADLEVRLQQAFDDIGLPLRRGFFNPAGPPP